MPIYSSFLSIWLLLIGSLGIIERAHMARRVERAAMIPIRATEDDVIRILGTPLEQHAQYDGWFLGLGARPPRWLYGTHINLRDLYIPKWPYVCCVPINLRIFTNDEQDLIIEWSSNQKVSKVLPQEIETDPRAEQFLKSMSHLSDWFALLERLSMQH